MISAIILAAGQSLRFGSAKLLQPWGESTILEQTVANLLNSKVNEVILVLGNKAEEIAKRIDRWQVKIVINPRYQQGMSTSIVAGLGKVDDKAQAVLLALGDQPLVGTEIINTLVEAFKGQPKGIAVPVYQGKRGNPVIFHIKYKKELLQLTGDVGGRDIVSRHPGDVLEVEVSSPSILMDIDTTEDYQRQRGIDKLSTGC